VQAHPQKFWSVENPGKIPENQAKSMKMFAKYLKFWANYLKIRIKIRVAEPGSSRNESEVFGWSRSRILKTLGVGVGFFCPTPDVQLDHFLHHTLKFGIPVDMVQFLLKLLLKQISCCVPRFPLILTTKLHSLYTK